MSTQVMTGRRPGRSLSRRTLIVLAAVIIVVLAALWALFFSSWFKVDDVQVTGTSILSAEEVLAAAAVPADVALLRLDGDGIAERVGALAPVADVAVTRSWPKTVRITVVERRPALAVPSDAAFSVYDEAGVGFLEVATPPEGVPVLTTADADDLVLSGVLEVLGELPEALRGKLAAVRADTPDAIELDLIDGVTIVWGSADESARKADVLVALMKQPGRVYIVSAPDAPAIRQ